MTKCIFCGREESSFKGLHLITNDGHVHFFCSSKCRKNALKLKRDKRRLKWTEAYLAEKAKAMQKKEYADKEKVEEKKEGKQKEQ